MLEMRVALIAALVGLVGCGAAVPPVPGKGGPAWIELTSEHFTVWTDAEPERARELVRDMENLRQVVVGVAFPSLSTGGRTLVFALRDDEELKAFTRHDRVAAWASSASEPLWQPMIVLSTFSNRNIGDTTLAHELTHAISFAVIHQQPRWLSEGMAEFFETVRFSRDGTGAEIGNAPDFRGAPIRKAPLIPIRKLLAWRTRDHEDGYYSTAWALFTFLINAHRDELVRYLQALRTRGKPREETTAAEAAQLWREAFPSLSIDEIDVELRQWLLTGRHVVERFTVKRRSWPIAERKLDDADVYATRGLLRLMATEHEAQARADLAAALAIEPTNVLARLGTLALKQPMTAADARAMAAAHRGDWRAWWLASMVLQGPDADESEVRAMREKACALIAHNPALVAPPGLCEPEAAAATP